MKWPVSIYVFLKQADMPRPTRTKGLSTQAYQFQGSVMDRRARRDEGDVELYSSVIYVATQKTNVKVGIAKVVFVFATSHPANLINVGSDGVDNASVRNH
jgi:hypothetical protein